MLFYSLSTTLSPCLLIAALNPQFIISGDFAFNSEVESMLYGLHWLCWLTIFFRFLSQAQQQAVKNLFFLAWPPSVSLSWLKLMTHHFVPL